MDTAWDEKREEGDTTQEAQRKPGSGQHQHGPWSQQSPEEGYRPARMPQSTGSQPRSPDRPAIAGP